MIFACSNHLHISCHGCSFSLHFLSKQLSWFVCFFVSQDRRKRKFILITFPFFSTLFSLWLGLKSKKRKKHQQQQIQTGHEISAIKACGLNAHYRSGEHEREWKMGNDCTFFPTQVFFSFVFCSVFCCCW